MENPFALSNLKLFIPMTGLLSRLLWNCEG
jgi:hypothetical protein